MKWFSVELHSVDLLLYIGQIATDSRSRIFLNIGTDADIRWCISNFNTFSNAFRHVTPGLFDLNWWVAVDTDQLRAYGKLKANNVSRAAV